MERSNVIVDMTLSFALDIIAFTDQLNENKKFVIGQQLLKSGTAIGANVKEAQNCESKADFIHKLKIAAKEADETEYWLILCQHAKDYPFDKVLFDKLKEIQKIINKIIYTSKQRIT
ncbi:MAG: four helix bundle protein [Proteiniphilum sp.]|jgi:four helix bundle protein|nr:four helix bundle protein [Proteiniphilum sp.]